MVAAPPYSSSMNDMEVNAVFEVLSDERRRTVLEYLLKRQRPVPVGDLVDSVVAAESNGHARADNRRNEVVVSLHHNHLPKLASSKLIDYDAEKGLITVREAAYTVEPYLEIARDIAATDKSIECNE